MILVVLIIVLIGLKCLVAFAKGASEAAEMVAKKAEEKANKVIKENQEKSKQCL